MTTTLKTDKSGSTSHSSSNEELVVAAKGGGITFAGNLFVYLVRFGFGLVLARLLGAEKLGLYNLSLTVAGVSSAMAVLGLDAGVARYVPIALREKNDTMLRGVIQIGIGFSAIIASLFALGVFLLAEPLAQHIYHRPDLAPILRMVSPDVLSFSLIVVLVAIVQGFKRMEYKVLSQDMAFNLLKFIFAVLFIGIGLGVKGAVAAHVLASWITVVLLLYFVNRLFPLRQPLSIRKRLTKSLLRFSFPLYLSQLLRYFSGSIETLVLGVMGLMSSVGIYATALRLSEIGLMFHDALRRISVPLISDLYTQRKFDRLGHIYQTTTKWDMTFNLPVFLTVTIFANPLLVLFGEDFIAGTGVLFVFAFSSLFNAITGVCGSVITMTGHSKMTFINSVIYLVVNVVLDILFIPRWDMLGAALAVTLSGVFINTLRVIQVFVLFRLWPYNWSFLKPLLAAFFAAGVVYGAQKVVLVSLPALFEIVIGSVLLWGIYALMIVSLKLSEEDRMILGRVVSRFRKIFLS